MVIIGAGFAGLSAANLLKKHVRLTILDRHNYHLFQPLLYQVATCELSPSDITVSIREQFKGHSNVSVLKEKAKKLDLPKKEVITASGLTIPYDYLVIAVGSESNFFGNNHWENYAIGLKNLSDALKIRNIWLNLLETAESTYLRTRKPMEITCAIVGGGPTGIELVGSILEFTQYSLKSNFHNITAANIKVILIESGPRILPGFSPESSDFANRTLKNLGAVIKLNTKVADIRNQKITFTNGESIRADLIIWAAGVKAANIQGMLPNDIEIGTSGKIKVMEDLTLKCYRDVFVLGDISEIDKNPLPGLAAVAAQQGKFAGKAIITKMHNNQQKLKFHYRDWGKFAIIGRYSGIAELPKISFRGAIGWLIWNLAHIYLLIGFRNQLIVFVKWCWIYMTRHKHETVILKDEDR